MTGSFEFLIGEIETKSVHLIPLFSGVAAFLNACAGTPIHYIEDTKRNAKTE